MVKVQQRGLGKGLSALISESYVSTAVSEPAETPPVGTLPITSLMAGKYQPRVRFAEDQLHELAASIERNGIMQPIIVRASDKLPNKYEIIAGERRWRAAHMAGLTHVPVIVRELTDGQALELALIENIQRQDLSPLEEALGYQRLLEEFNYTQEKLAETVGKSRSHVTNLLRLLGLPEPIKALLEEGRLSMGHARALLTSPNNVALAYEAAEKGLSVRQVEERARGSSGAEKQPRGRSNNAAPRAPHPSYADAAPKDPDIVALESTLSESLGMQVDIRIQGQGGEIAITYESLNQLDEVLRRLGGTV